MKTLHLLRTLVVLICAVLSHPAFAEDKKFVIGVTKGAIAAYGLDYYLVVNQKAAEAQGVVLTPEFLKMADKVIK
jgi:ABC-type uncharacterized transport system substrate-binding protein